MSVHGYYLYSPYSYGYYPYAASYYSPLYYPAYASYAVKPAMAIYWMHMKYKISR